MQTSFATTELALEHVFHSDILPALPHSALAIAEISDKDEQGLPRLIKAIEADPGLMGQVLRFANLTEFRCSGQIMSVDQAMAQVGARAVCNFAMWNAVFSLKPNPKFGPFELKVLWRDSLRRAVFARSLAKSLKLDIAGDLFAAALLQDMAIPLLLKELPAEYEELVQRRAEEGRRLSGLEKEMFGWDHADAAAMLAKRWHLPARFIDILAHHTHVDDILNRDAEERGKVCVALAALLPSCSDEQWSLNEKSQFIDGYTQLTGEPEESIQDLFRSVDRENASYAELMRVDPPKRSLAVLA